MMLHQPVGAIGGTSKDIELQAREVLHWKANLARIFCQLTGKPLDTILDQKGNGLPYPIAV